MTAAGLHGGVHLRGLLPPVPGVRDDFAIPVVRRVRRKLLAGVVVDVVVRWSDRTSCRYEPGALLDVLEVAP